MAVALPKENSAGTSGQNSEILEEKSTKIQQATSRSVPSLYAVLSREAQFQAIVEEAYARREQAVEDAYSRAPELVSGDMTDVYERVDRIRERIAESMRAEIEEIEKRSKENCKKFRAQQGSYNEEAREYVMGLVTGTVAAETVAGEVPAC